MKARLWIISILTGIFAGLGLGFASALFLGGAGHGWCSSFLIALSALYLPVLLVGFLMPKSKGLKYCALYVLVCCLVVDAVILFYTFSEGWQVVRKIAAMMPIPFTIWVLVWLALHVAVAFLCKKAFHTSTLTK